METGLRPRLFLQGRRSGTGANPASPRLDSTRRWFRQNQPDLRLVIVETRSAVGGGVLQEVQPALLLGGIEPREDARRGIEPAYFGKVEPSFGIQLRLPPRLLK